MSELSPDYSQILKQQIITGLFPDSQTTNYHRIISRFSN